MNAPEPTSAPPTLSASSPRVWARGLLFAGGLALAGWLVWSAGLARVADTLREAGRFLPAVVLLELGVVATDVLALRTLLGATSATIPRAVWTRSTALAYASAVVLPAGRAAGEAVRTAALASTVGLASAAGACSRLQAAALLGNAFASALCAASVAGAHVGGALALALFGNALFCLVLGGGLLLLLENARFARWARARFPRLALRRGDALEPSGPLRARVAGAAIFCALGRIAQAVQYGVIVYAVGGRAAPGAALAAQGIHLVGATIGDVVPNQMGATEGAYRVFADALGLGEAPARALSIALVVRIAQVALAALGFVVGFATPRQPPAAESA